LRSLGTSPFAYRPRILVEKSLYDRLNADRMYCRILFQQDIFLYHGMGHLRQPIPRHHPPSQAGPETYEVERAQIRQNNAAAGLQTQ